LRQGGQGRGLAGPIGGKGKKPRPQGKKKNCLHVRRKYREPKRRKLWKEGDWAANDLETRGEGRPLGKMSAAASTREKQLTSFRKKFPRGGRRKKSFSSGRTQERSYPTGGMERNIGRGAGHSRGLRRTQEKSIYRRRAMGRRGKWG